MSGPAPASSPTAAKTVDAYRRQGARRALLTVALLFAALLAFLADLLTGSSGLSAGDALAVLLGGGTDETTLVIIRDIRLPAALTAALAGAALAVSGAEMQTIYDNPLADSFTLGVSAAATFGTALAVVAGVGLPFVPVGWSVPANAFLFALGSTLLLQGLARSAGGGSQTLVLLGIALVFTFNALTALLQFVASRQALQQLVFWLLGTLANARWDTIGPLIAAIVLLLPTAFAQAWALTALRLGEERAASLGLDVKRLRLVSLLRTSLLTGACVAVIGIVGFVGLVAPHIARLLVGEDHRFFLPVAALTGACLLSLASVLSKLVLPGAVLPVGIVTALIGLPVFFALVVFRRAP